MVSLAVGEMIDFELIVGKLLRGIVAWVVFTVLWLLVIGVPMLLVFLIAERVING